MIKTGLDICENKQDGTNVIKAGWDKSVVKAGCDKCDKKQDGTNVIKAGWDKCDKSSMEQT